MFSLLLLQAKGVRTARLLSGIKFTSAVGCGGNNIKSYVGVCINLVCLSLSAQHTGFMHACAVIQTVVCIDHRVATSFTLVHVTNTELLLSPGIVSSIHFP